MTQTDLIQSITRIVSEKFKDDTTGHDWYHILRVTNTAKTIAAAEGADAEIVELAALLHDIADHKFHDNDLSEGPRQARELILSQGGSESLAEKVADIVAQVSYKGAGVDTPVNSLEAAVVQDADRLDAMGAIGIARAFAFGGSRNRAMYLPDQKPVNHANFKSYATDQGHTINHFYEKLLLLKDRMQTETGREMADGRHLFMESYLDRFFGEWEGLN